MRYFVELAYNGKAYHGWQNQPTAISVQEVVEHAISTILKQKISIVGAGRTDAGVHAQQIFAHLDLDTDLYEEQNLKFRLNSLLPNDIVVKDFFKVKKEVHARFDALSRSYEYHVVQEKNPFEIDRAFLLKNKLDVALMNKAAQQLLGTQDFKCFSKSRTDVYTYICNIEHAFWEEEDEKLVFKIKADRFLRNMVRAIVGTLLEIGAGKMKPENLEHILASRSRSEAGTSVPAHGLYLTRVEYPDNIKMN